MLSNPLLDGWPDPLHVELASHLARRRCDRGAPRVTPIRLEAWRSRHGYSDRRADRSHAEIPSSSRPAWRSGFFLVTAHDCRDAHSEQAHLALDCRYSCNGARYCQYVGRCLDRDAARCTPWLSFFALRSAYWRTRGREGIGLGDVKLAVVAGAFIRP
jgi:hypothetical protein